MHRYWVYKVIPTFLRLPWFYPCIIPTAPRSIKLVHRCGKFTISVNHFLNAKHGFSASMENLYPRVSINKSIFLFPLYQNRCPYHNNFYCSTVIKYCTNIPNSYPLVNVYIAMDNHHAING